MQLNLIKCPNCLLSWEYPPGITPAPGDECGACGVMLMGRARHPHVQVRLIGGDGNAFAILSAVDRAMREAGVADDERAAFRDEATAGDYDHLLATASQWVTVL